MKININDEIIDLKYISSITPIEIYNPWKAMKYKRCGFKIHIINRNPIEIYYQSKQEDNFDIPEEEENKIKEIREFIIKQWNSDNKIEHIVINNQIVRNII